MKRFQKYFTKFLRIIISGSLRHLLFRLIGLNNYISLMLKVVDHRGNQRAKKNILCIERRLFEKDIDELSNRIRKYGWIWLRKNQITVYQVPILPKGHLKQTEYLNKINEAPQQWKECIRRSKILIKRFQNEQNICALMLGNLDYWQDFTLRVACIELGIPVLVLQKEYPYYDSLVDKYLEHWRKYNYKPNADAIMVFGKKMKEGYSRIAGFDVNKVFVTGSPRIDRWRSIENNSQSTNEGLVIISFMLRGIADESFLNMLIKISKYFKSENLGKITVKNREQTDQKIIMDFCKKENLENIDVVQNISLHDLVSQSKAVIALNSLATIESMLSKKPILVPDWFIKNKDEKLFDSNDKLSQTVVKLCMKEEDLLNNIGQIFKNTNSDVSEECMKARREFIGKFWEYDDNETACSKVQKVIDNFVEGVSN